MNPSIHAIALGVLFPGQSSFPQANPQPGSTSPSWLAPLGGEPGTNKGIHAMAVYDDGGGPALYAGGVFTSAGGVPARRVAKWDGSSWTALGSGVGGNPGHSRVEALVAYDDGGGQALYAGGRFTTAGGMMARGVAKWDGFGWAALGSGTNNIVHSLTVHDDGGGSALYAGGLFTSAGGGAADRIARWDGLTWASLGSGTNGAVLAMTSFDDGSGTALYAGGVFTSAGGVTANRIAKWDGSSWAALGTGTNGAVHALTVYDDESGQALYAGGLFTSAGGVAASNLARWDGSTWTAVGSGTSSGVHSLTVYDDGGGQALFAGGSFGPSGLSHLGNPFPPCGIRGCPPSGPRTHNHTELGRGVAKWDGSNWAAVDGGAGGVMGPVEALTVFDDGGGLALYAGGHFTTAGGVMANNIARWNSSSWSDL